jgi:hypothetical protein
VLIDGRWKYLILNIHFKCREEDWREAGERILAAKCLLFSVGNCQSKWLYSDMWRRVVWLTYTRVSKEHAISGFIVEASHPHTTKPVETASLNNQPCNRNLSCNKNRRWWSTGAWCKVGYWPAGLTCRYDHKWMTSGSYNIHGFTLTSFPLETEAGAIRNAM